MPNRILRDGILSSEGVCSLSWSAEVFYRRLMSVADDHGRFHGIPTLIRSACYPLQIDKVSDSDIGKWLTDCVTAALVRVYPASDGKRYVQIVKFGQQVRSKSKFPDPIDGEREQLKSSASNCEQVESNAHLVVGVCEDVGVCGADSAKPRTSRRKKPETFPLPDDFGISSAVQAWATAKGHTRLPEHLESFRAKAKAKGYTYADWDAALMEAVRNDWAKLTPINGAAPRRALKELK